MWMMRFSSIVVLVALWSGCGSRGATPEPVTPPAPQTMVKASLDDIIASGSLRSAETLQEQLELMKKTDSAKAEQLLKDHAQLMTLSDPRAIKAKGQEMANKL